jgi:hypothetical protein
VVGGVLLVESSRASERNRNERWSKKKGATQHGTSMETRGLARRTMVVMVNTRET